MSQRVISKGVINVVERGMLCEAAGRFGVVTENGCGGGRVGFGWRRGGGGLVEDTNLAGMG